jgi:hypothetical protein
MLKCHARFKQSARPPASGEAAQPPSEHGPVPEAQVADARAGLTPADMVRRRLSTLLHAAARALGRVESGSCNDCEGMDREAPPPGGLARQSQRFDK